jgi:hypothetical protein
MPTAADDGALVTIDRDMPGLPRRASAQSLPRSTFQPRLQQALAVRVLTGRHGVQVAWPLVAKISA